MDAPPATPRWLKNESLRAIQTRYGSHWRIKFFIGPESRAEKIETVEKTLTKQPCDFCPSQKKNVVHLKHHIFDIYLSLWAWLITPPFEQSLSHICFFRFTSLWNSTQTPKSPERWSESSRDSPRLDPLYDDPIECDSLVAKRQPVQWQMYGAKLKTVKRRQNDMGFEAKIACRFERFT